MAYKWHCKVVMQGVLGASVAAAVETFSFSTKWRSVPTGTNGWPSGQNWGDSLSSSEMDTLAESIRDGVEDDLTDALFPSNVFWQEVRVYNIAPDGLAAGQIGYGVYSTAKQGGTNSDFKPFQITPVVSLVAAGRTAGKYGRFYLPPTVNTVANTGRMTSGGSQQIADWAGVFLEHVNDTLQDGLAAIDFDGNRDVELINASAKTTGTNVPVAEIRVGDVFDTQRRRRRNLAENYVVRAYP